MADPDNHRNLVERLRKGFENAGRAYECPDGSYFWPDDPRGQVEIVNWLSTMVLEPHWPIAGRWVAYALLQHLASERKTFHPSVRHAIQAAAGDILAAGPPKQDGRRSEAGRDGAIVDMYRSLKRQDYDRPEVVGLLAQAVGIGKDRVNGILRAAGVD